MPLPDKATSRILGWRGKHLLYAGRLQLIKAVLNNLASYRISIYKLPKETIHEVKRLCWNLLWNGPDGITLHTLVGFDDLCYLFEEGGMGIRDLEIENTSAILRHLWSIVTNTNTLWVC